MNRHVVLALLFVATSAVAKPKRTRCDAEALIMEAIDLDKLGQRWAALAKLDESLKCAPTERANKLAAFMSCDYAWRQRHDENGFWRNRFKRYYDKLSPAGQSSVRQCFNRCGGI